MFFLYAFSLERRLDVVPNLHRGVTQKVSHQRVIISINNAPIRLFFQIKCECIRSTGILKVSVKYSMRVCDVISYWRAWSCDLDVTELQLKTRKGEKVEIKEIFVHEIPSIEYGLWVTFIAC